jgi:Protein of unknown function (DUF2505)
VQFSFQHELDMPVDAIELALRSPRLSDAFAEQWDGVASVEALEHEASGDHIARVWRCEAKAPLKILRGYEITRDMLTWEEHWRYDTEAHKGNWHIVPRPGVDLDAAWRKHFAMRGCYRLEPLPDGRCRRSVEGDLRIEIKMVGKVVERLAVAELRKAFDAEAAAVDNLASLP